MRISDILGPSAVKSMTSGSSKKRLFQSIGDIAAANFGLDASGVVDALTERENLGPTGVGHGVALPHARLETLERVRGIFVRLDKPVDFDSVDRQPVDLVFALFAPVDAGVDHLKALAVVSRTLRSASVCTKLRANADEATLFMLLTEASADQAA